MYLSNSFRRRVREISVGHLDPFYGKTTSPLLTVTLEPKSVEVFVVEDALLVIDVLLEVLVFN